MDNDELVQRNDEVKKHVVKLRFRYPKARSGLYQVWQPSPFAWEYAMQCRDEDRRPRPCMSEFLEFPLDYSLVALVFGDSLKDVHRKMCFVHDEDSGEHIIILANHLRSGSPCDVIVPPGGTPQFVTDGGFVSLKSNAQAT